MKPRVRFAPSPTGFLHIGGARTALFNWLFARHHGGTFILRIEDTDVARNTQAAVEVILDGLRWLGLDWDEGPVTSDATGPSRGPCGPYFQSQRKDCYRRRVEALLSRGLAYEKDGAIRFKMKREPITIPDLVCGNIVRPLTDREQADPDFVIVRSDGEPVFHLVNVVDDLDMGITHVIRGEDHLTNTAKHIALFEAFDVAPPKYAHIPLILNPDGSKMSKRDQGAIISVYMEEGYAPEAVLNYLCLLGWSPKDNREIMPLAEIIERFDLPGVLRSGAKFDMTKLQWMNWEYIRTMPNERYYDLAVHALGKAGINTNAHDPAYVRAALDTVKEKPKTFSELPGWCDFYFKEELTYAPEAVERDFVPANKANLARLRDALEQLSSFKAADIEATLKATAKELGVKPAVLVHPTRLA
ncbi:MAG: glutamate--tRNA ligase, partial [Limisphaerales bacterium]